MQTDSYYQDFLHRTDSRRGLAYLKRTWGICYEGRRPAAPWVPHPEQPDFLSDVLLLIEQKQQLYDPNAGSFSTWVWTVARRRSIDLFPPSPGDDGVEVTLNDFDCPASLQENHSNELDVLDPSVERQIEQLFDSIETLVAKLSPQQHQVLYLTMAEPNWNDEKIAAQLGLRAPSQVKGARAQVYGKLRELDWLYCETELERAESRWKSCERIRRLAADPESSSVKSEVQVATAQLRAALEHVFEHVKNGTKRVERTRACEIGTRLLQLIQQALAGERRELEKVKQSTGDERKEKQLTGEIERLDQQVSRIRRSLDILKGGAT